MQKDRVLCEVETEEVLYIIYINVSLRRPCCVSGG